jgi:transaldolase
MFSVDDLSAALIHRRRGMAETIETSEGKPLAHPASRAPRIFADTAKIDDIKPLFDAGIIDGVTTNPTLLKQAGAQSWEGAKEKLVEILRALDPYPVSLELTKLRADEMVRQADELNALGPNAVIKVPVGGYTALDETLDPHTGLSVLRELWRRDIRTNATLIFNSTQALWAAKAGATYVSPFLGRLADYMYKNDHPERTPGNSLYWIENHKDPEGTEHTSNTEYVASGGPRKDAGVRLIREIAAIFANYDIRSEILAASFRNFSQISEVLLAGADILTVPAGILTRVADHPLTHAGMLSFDADAKTFA